MNPSTVDRIGGPIDGPVLALDSSSGGGSAALGVGGRVVAQVALEDGRGSSATLLPAVDRVLREGGVAPRDLGAVVVGGGPGSFTGLRIAAATAKGIVRALGVPLFAYSGLLAAAAAHRAMGRPVCALFDARNREVFAGCWRLAEGGVEEVLAPAALSVDALAAALGGVDRPLFTGDGAAMHAGEIEAAFGAGSVAAQTAESPAAGLLWLARTVPAVGRVGNAAAWEPEYLRPAGAERIAAARGG